MSKKLSIKILALALMGLTAIYAWGRHNKENNFANNFLAQVAAVESEQAAQTLLAQPGAGNSGVKVPILVYHSTHRGTKEETEWQKKFNVTPDVLESQLKYLKDKGYAGIFPEDLAAHLIKNSPISPNPIILTFDDGWESQYIYAFPLLKKYGFKGTFFIFTNSIGKKHFMDQTELENLLKNGMEIGSHTISHPYLYKIKDEAALKKEIMESKIILESLLKTPITAFAVPFGWSNEHIAGIIKEAGYAAGRTSFKGAYHTPKDVFSLKSLQAPNNLNEFIELLK